MLRQHLDAGSGALDILLTLLEHAPKIVSTRDLIQRALGALVVDQVSLRVHMALPCASGLVTTDRLVGTSQTFLAEAIALPAT